MATTEQILDGLSNQICLRFGDRTSLLNGLVLNNQMLQGTSEPPTAPGGGGGSGVALDPTLWPQVPDIHITIGGSFPPIRDKDRIMVDPLTGEIWLLPYPTESISEPSILLGPALAKISDTSPLKGQNCDISGGIISDEELVLQDPLGVSPALNDIVVIQGWRDRTTGIGYFYILGSKGGASADEQVKVSADDASAGYLEDKIDAGIGTVPVVETDGGGNEKVAIDFDFNSLAVDGAPDPATDYVATFKGGTTHKRVLLNDLPNASLPAGGLQAQVLQKDAGLNVVWDYVRSA